MNISTSLGKETKSLVISRREIKGLCFWNQANTYGNCTVLKYVSYSLISFSHFSAVFKQCCFYLYLSFILCEIQALCPCLTVIGMFIFSTCFFFLCYNPAGLRRMCQLDYLNLWRYLYGKVWSFLFSCLRQKWKTTGWKDPHNALLRLQHHRITIHITVAVAGLRKTDFEHFLFWYRVLHLVFSINIHHKLLIGYYKWTSENCYKLDHNKT